jgi:hypothetical protein
LRINVVIMTPCSTSTTQGCPARESSGFKTVMSDYGNSDAG